MARITETVLRDAHQSLFATRMRTDDMLEVLEQMDKVGYQSIEMWGGATFDACLRFLNEDPWDRLRKIKSALKNTRTQMLLRGQNLVGYSHYADDVVDEFVALAAKNGIDIFRIFDALNDTRNMERAIAAVIKAGKQAQGTICFTKSPVHSLDGFAEVGRKLKDLGCESICLKDMSGLLTPADAIPLVKRLKTDLGLPVQVHSHNTAGYAQATYFASIASGADAVDCAISPFSNGTSQPPTESMVAALDGTQWKTGYDLSLFEPISSYFSDLREKYEGLINPLSERIDVRVLKYQVPGGMLSNLISQLEEQGYLDKFEDVLAEVPKVREDLGWIPLVTPTSQIVGTQAVMNVVQGERYKMMTHEVKDLALGGYGKTPAPVKPEIIKLAGNDEREPITVRPGDLIEAQLGAVKEKYGDLIKSPEDAITLALFDDVAEEFLKGEAVCEELPSAEKSPEDKKKKESTKTEDKKSEKEKTKQSDARAYEIVVQGQAYHVEVHPSELGKTVSVAVQNASAAPPSPARPTPFGASGPAPAPAAIPAPASPSFTKPAPAPAPVKVEEKKNKPSEVSPDDGEIETVPCPMQGTIMSVDVTVGQEIEMGQRIGVLEAMKMENDLLAPCKGVVIKVSVSSGDAVKAGQVLIEIQKNG